MSKTIQVDSTKDARYELVDKNHLWQTTASTNW